MQKQLEQLFNSLESLNKSLRRKQSFTAAFCASIGHLLRELNWNSAFVQFKFKHNPHSFWITQKGSRKTAFQPNLYSCFQKEQTKDLTSIEEWPGSLPRSFKKQEITNILALRIKSGSPSPIQIHFFNPQENNPEFYAGLRAFLEMICTLAYRDDFEYRLLKIQRDLNALLQQDHQTLEPVDLIALACPIISRFFQAERTTFFVFDERENRLQSIYAEGPTPLKILLDVGEGLVGACFQSLTPSYTNTPYAKRSFQKKYDRTTGFTTRSSLVTPLFMGDKPFGVLQILNRADGFRQENLEEIKAIAKTLAGHLNFYQFTRGGASARSELESLLQTIPEVLYRLDVDGHFGFLSQEVLKWGYFREDLLGKHFSNILHPDDVDRVSRDRVLPLYAGKITGQKGAPELFDERRSGKRGTKKVRLRIIPGPHIKYDEIYPGVHEDEEKVFHAEVNASGFWEKDPSGQSYFAGTMGLISDVTERFFAEKRLKSTQNELIRAERFAGLGTLSAGIAHDFNNILAAIGLSADVSKMLLCENDSREQLEETLDTIGEYVKKASDLTSRLLALGRSNISKVEPTRIVDIIQDATQIIRNQLDSKGISLQTIIRPEVPLCLLDRGQLRDVLINLITNSMHSLAERTRQEGHSKRPLNIKIETRKKNQNLILIVEDNGIGIDPKILSRIFDPFFTTKNRDSRKGTGLGLAMVFSIVKSHGGNIHVDSKIHRKNSKKESSSGTTITIELPIKVADEMPIKIDSKITPLKFSKESLIYVVDDEQSLLDLMSVVLSSAGFSNIKSFSNGTEALEEFEEETTPPRVIITDVVMPPLDGLGLCKEVKKLNSEPQPTFIITSGKLSEDVQEEFQSLGVRYFLKKPCSKDDILNSLREALFEGEAL